MRFQPKVPVPKGLIVNAKVKTPKQLEKEAKRLEKANKQKVRKKGRWSRDKGHGFEREIAIMFREIGYPKACRQLEYQEGKGVDLANTGIYDIQCKRGRKYASLSAIKEVPFAEGRVPLLITRGDYEETLVAMPLKHFLGLIKIQPKP